MCRDIKKVGNHCVREMVGLSAGGLKAEKHVSDKFRNDYDLPLTRQTVYGKSSN